LIVLVVALVVILTLCFRQCQPGNGKGEEQVVWIWVPWKTNFYPWPLNTNVVTWSSNAVMYSGADTLRWRLEGTNWVPFRISTITGTNVPTGPTFVTITNVLRPDYSTAYPTNIHLVPCTNGLPPPGLVETGPFIYIGTNRFRIVAGD